ncbi:hypothetical protein K505DRAFT_323302 [Melanomma pulvis-pyrius CBS 109.77]|uniref:Uncharacterized protein n=1 Tax=Melanomma pulvis-pyrius CBS 109.77 TaxID=1314802 RepID=A0A6A6XIV2_9PLEO|nr:hypothetical protein K505DRAFT_323302 [Melanomma pulvis-pyrius CBS 109.77]
MQLFATLAVLIASANLSSAWPHQRQAPVADDNLLEVPMHTTALMAGAAWDLSQSAYATQTPSVAATAVPANPTGLDGQHEL